MVVKYYNPILYFFNTAKFNIKGDSEIEYLKNYKLHMPADIYSILNEYLNNSIIRTKIFSIGYSSSSGISMSEFQRKFTLTGKDIRTEEYYKFKNNDVAPLTSFSVYQFGGSIHSFNKDSMSAMEKNGRWSPAHINLILRAERGYIASISLSNPVNTNETCEVKFIEEWPDAMLEKWDIVLLPQSCYYGGIGNLIGDIYFDSDVDKQYLMEIDALTGAVFDKSHLIKEKRNKKLTHYTFSYEHVASGKIMCWLFERKYRL